MVTPELLHRFRSVVSNGISHYYRNISPVLCLTPHLRPIFTRLDDDRDDMLTFDQLYDALLAVTTNSFTAREMLYLFNVLSLTNEQKVVSHLSA